MLEIFFHAFDQYPPPRARPTLPRCQSSGGPGGRRAGTQSSTRSGQALYATTDARQYANYVVTDTPPLTVVPQFPGGDTALLNYLAHTTTDPRNSRRKRITGKPDSRFLMAYGRGLRRRGLRSQKNCVNAELNLKMGTASKRGKYVSLLFSSTMKFSSFAFAAGLGFLTTTASFAQTAPVPGSDRARIQQGVKSGELTRAEAARVRTQQADANQARKVARADGTVTSDERAIIRKEEAQADRVLYNQKHDEQTRKPR